MYNKQASLKKILPRCKLLSKGFLLQEEYHMLCGTAPGALVSRLGPKAKGYSLYPIPPLSPPLSGFWVWFGFFSSLPIFILVWFLFSGQVIYHSEKPHELHCSQQANSTAQSRRSAGIPCGPRYNSTVQHNRVGSQREEPAPTHDLVFSQKLQSSSSSPENSGSLLQ